VKYWLIFVVAALVILLVVLLVGFAIRLALLAMLVVAAPLALACHALPHLETLAHWWWRTFAAVLGIQVGQALVFAVAVRVFFPEAGGHSPLGSGPTEPVMMLILALAVIVIMVKVPVWALRAANPGQRRSLLGSMIRTYLAFKTFGLLKGGLKKA